MILPVQQVLVPIFCGSLPTASRSPAAVNLFSPTPQTKGPNLLLKALLRTEEGEGEGEVQAVRGQGGSVIGKAPWIYSTGVGQYPCQNCDDSASCMQPGTNTHLALYSRLPLHTQSFLEISCQTNVSTSGAGRIVEP